MLTSGFYAYSDTPANHKEVITAFIKKVNEKYSGDVSIMPWEEMRINGKLIIDVICEKIDASDLFCADITHYNPNVMFELGYAIAKGKRIWLSVEAGGNISEEQKKIFNFLSVIGYAEYSNSDKLLGLFGKERPDTDLSSTLYGNIIEPWIEKPSRINSKPSLLYLKPLYDNEFCNRANAFIEGLDYNKTIDDPTETFSQTIQWYGEKVANADLVVCSMSGKRRQKGEVINSRHAFFCGMAKGLGREIAIYAEDGYSVPLDFRENVCVYTTAQIGLEHLESFIGQFESIFAEKRIEKAVTSAPNLDTFVKLSDLDIGDILAENENIEMLDECFIRTIAYEEAVDGKNTIFVGRKGSGKTACFIQLEQELSKNIHNLVVKIAPDDYEFTSIISALSKIEITEKFHVFDSLWKYLIYTEILVSVKHEYIRSNGCAVTEVEKSLDNLINLQKIESEPFSIRLEKCLEDLLNKLGNYDLNTIENQRTAISKILHDEFISKARLLLGRYFEKKHRLMIIIDNLDKAWSKNSNIDFLSNILWSLLRVGTKLDQDFKHSDSRKQHINARFAIFLREDIFDIIRKNSREPDKILFNSLAWEDNELLLRVIDERLLFNQPKKLKNTNRRTLWGNYFSPIVEGKDIVEYIQECCIPRPRDYLFLMKAAISTARNRKHLIVEEEDFLRAETQYSKYAVETIEVEHIFEENTHSLIYSLIGQKSVLQDKDIDEISSEIGIERDVFLETLVLYGVLSIRVSKDSYRNIINSNDYIKTKRLAEVNAKNFSYPISWKITRAFWKELEINIV